MPSSALQDGREYLFPIFDVVATDTSVELQDRKFLGTGFFVSECGDAITAAHVIPDPSQLEAGRRLVAVVLVGGVETVCWINHAAILSEFDFALVKVNLENTKYFEILEEEILAGTDIAIVGIPSHQVIGEGLEMRVLKGHVTAVMPRLELNFPVPAGMSGSPILLGSKAVGFATGRVRSETIDEQTEELVTITNTFEWIEIRTTSSIIYYGLANSFWMMRAVKDPIFDGKTVYEFIKGLKA